MVHCVKVFLEQGRSDGGFVPVFSVIGKTGQLHVSNVLCEVDDEEDVQERTENLCAWVDLFSVREYWPNRAINLCYGEKFLVYS